MELRGRKMDRRQMDVFNPAVQVERRKGERRQGDRRQGERRQAGNQSQHTGRRTHERRWDNARFFLVERRKGNRWKYGSITLAFLLMTTAGVLLK
jgi:hypothetical protein